jgi:hypothetical protein
MIAFIDDNRGTHGPNIGAIWPICKLLSIAHSTYHGHVAERRDPYNVPMAT